jgi:glycosyltransferase involved in cell wall biosynthesis
MAAEAISVVVPTRDRAGRLEALLDALGRQTLQADRFEVVVVDDLSSDSTPAVLAGAGERVHAVRGRGAGPAAARNDGWRQARGEIVAFTDDDCEPDPGWLEALLAALGDGENAFAQGPTRPIERERHLLEGFARTKEIEALGPWFQTCNMAYPRSLLERLGGFDESFRRPFGEDADLAWRAIEAGAEPRFASDAVVHHAVERWRGVDLMLSGLRDPDEALAFRKHPGLLESVRFAGVFKAQSHGLLGLAALGALAAARGGPRWSLALTLPYLRLIAARCARMGPRPAAAPYLIGHDVLEIWSAARGSIRHRVAAL